MVKKNKKLKKYYVSRSIEVLASSHKTAAEHVDSLIRTVTFDDVSILGFSEIDVEEAEDEDESHDETVDDDHSCDVQYVNLMHVEGYGWVFWDLKHPQESHYGPYLTKSYAITSSQFVRHWGCGIELVPKRRQ